MPAEDYFQQHSSTTSAKRRASQELGSAFKKMVVTKIDSKVLWSIENRKNYTPTLRQPHDILFINDRKLLVSDGLWPHSNLKMFEHLNKWRPTKTLFAASQLLPFGIERFNEDEILISDHCQRTVVMFNLNTLNIDYNWTSTDTHFSWPLGICVSGSNVFVADSELKAIIVLDKCGKYLSKIQSKFLKRPEYVVESNGTLYVSDSVRERLESFDLQSGLWMGSIGENILKHPKGLALRNDKQLAVADWKANKVNLISLNGKFNASRIDCLSSDISYPRGLSIHNDIIAITQQKLKAPPAIKLLNFKL